MRLKPLDIAAALLATAAIVFSALSVYSGQGSELSAVVKGDGGEWVYPLSSDHSVEVGGILGVTFVAIHEGRVHISASPCRNQTCVAAGDISGAGQWLACLPNRVFVRIEGRRADDQPDASAY